ncbi:Cycloserine biosynthesis protein DcsG [Planctomycetes bacterium Pla163]|uniref:Cycloserine biosynthesis protein DcsG n=1 Tax=Rohdeia mirabilis TaxID=2528008 RepID=A0A518CYW7_9BACT|nr:Cycloserine biosynthesis protein DcsG [Planctomycetes bacterium Pla163]
MTRVAFLTSADMLPGHPALRSDHWELDREFEPMRAACATRGIALEVAVWDAPEFDPEHFDAVVIGTTWDYTSKPAAFLAFLDRCEAARPLFNPAVVVRWNLDKGYLADLAERGAPTVPTVFAPDASDGTIAEAFDRIGADELVVKPLVGASAWRQVRVRRGAPLPPVDERPPGRALIQPFLPAVATEGEYSFVYFDGELSHVARKVPAAGDYRVQSMFGARETVHEPSGIERDLSARVLAAVPERLLHARVDMVRGLDGELAVMELELIEPYLYPEQGPGMGEAFAAGLVRLLRASS